MIVGISGFGNSGSGAVVDYLRGYCKIDVFEKCEFQLLHETDGINDLKYHLVYSKERVACNAAIKRFVRLQKYGLFARTIRKIIGNDYDNWVARYVEELVSVKWMGRDSFHDPVDIRKLSKYKPLYLIQLKTNKLLQSINQNLHCPALSEKFFSIMDEDEFNQITKKYLHELFLMINIDIDENLSIVDMLFSSTNPEQGMEFFDDAKAIIVNRDPRDVYVSAKLHPEDSRFMPNDSVDKFIVYFRTMQRYLETSNNVLVVQYEDLIYKYTDTTNAIKAFLHINEMPDNEFVYFDPTYSVRYTKRQNLYDKYPDDVKMIEKELQEYLYDFENAQSPSEDKGVRIRKGSVDYKGWNMK